MLATKRALSALEARVAEQLEKLRAENVALRAQLEDLDPIEIENLRNQVLNAVRSLRRLKEAPDKGAATPLTLAEARRRIGRSP